MNCKQGDLAIRISAVDGCLIPVGAIVKVLSWCANSAQNRIGDTGLVRNAQNLWCVEYNGNAGGEDGIYYAIPDAELKPIRDQDGEDEMLKIAGYPKVKEKEIV